MNSYNSPQPPGPARPVFELTILYEVSQALQKTLDEEQALYTILVGVTAGPGLGFNRAFLLLVDGAEESLQGRMAIGPSSREEAAIIWRELREKHDTLGDLLRSIEKNGIKKDSAVNEVARQFQIPLADADDSIVAILRSRQPSLASGGRFRPHDIPVASRYVTILGTDRFAVAPLYLADHDLGLLIADNAINGAPIEANSVRLLQIYAQQASAAIQNTRLYREIKEKVALCENTNLALRENQYHLLQAERLSTIGKMAALLAHEIRTPLVSIGGFTRRLLRATPSEDPRREEMDIIVSEVARLERLVEEVLGYSKITKPVYESTDVNELIRIVVATIQRGIEKNDIRMVLELDPELPPAGVDKSQLQQALMNLITNGMDAMPSGGTLTIGSRWDNDFFEIRVRDTGVGIPREHWGKMFTPFYTTKMTGSGLGLAIVAQVVENHRGALRFESTPGQGTSFFIRLAIQPQGHSAALSPLRVAQPQEATP
jgi:signal transduction histidine kinase